MNSSRRLVYGLHFLLGIWLMFVPAIVDGSSRAANESATDLGIVLMVFSFSALLRSRNWEWVNFGVGILLFISPWVVRFSTVRWVAYNAWAVGFVVAISAFLLARTQVHQAT